MKKLSYLSVLMVCFFVVSMAANATGTRTEFAEFEISPVNNLYLGKNAPKVWTLNYNKSENPVTVVKHKTVEGVVYAVHSKYFEVSYAVTTTGFGAKAMKSTWSSVPRKITKAVISREGLEKQRILTPNKVDDEKALGLIASYLPELINDGYTHLLN
jgi:hypothetical protein